MTASAPVTMVGSPIESAGPLDLRFVSPDLNGDLRVDIADAGLFTIDLEMLADLFDIRHQVPGGVVDEIGVRRRAAGPALVEQGDLVGARQQLQAIRATEAGP